MLSLTGLIVCIFCLTYYAREVQGFPNCQKLGFVQHGMHRTLAEEITEIVKQNGSPAPDYSCTLERIAHKLLSKNGGLVGESYEGYKFTSTNGLGNINFWIVLNSWKENLSKMGKISRFGCDFEEFKEGGRTKSFAIACIYQ